MRTTTRFRLLITVLTLVVITAACGGGDDASGSASDTTVAGSDTTPASDATTETTVPQAATTSTPDIPGGVPTDYAGFREQPTACGAETPPEPTEMTFDAPADMGIDPEASPVVTARIMTSCGPILIALDPAAAPETVNSFVFLADQGYFDGTVSHRVLPGFVVQAGDPTATGSGGPGYTIPDELPADDFTYTTGTIAMANAGPGTSGSQFFIMLADGQLPPDYSVFGTMVDGIDTLYSIAALPLGDNPLSGEPSVPLETVYIESVEVDNGS